MTGTRLMLALTGAIVLLGAVLVAGAYNVSAAAGHLPLVSTLLRWTMHNSVTVRASGAVPENLDADTGVAAAAGHYDLVCRSCHGAPGLPRSTWAAALTPAPPDILEAMDEWQAEELFWIVKNGIKMTAMPAWPTQQRDDEVWSMVAFLQRLPTLSPDQYRRMALGPALEARPIRSDFQAELARCARCHGYDGRGVPGSAVPRLDGLSHRYLEDALHAYARGDRTSGLMQTYAAAVPAQQRRALAQHYAEAGQRSVRGEPPSGPDPRGRTLAMTGAPERGIPACAACHGPAPYPRSSAFPALTGQPADYLGRQLELFRDERRGGGRFSGLMTLAARQLTDSDIADLADFYARAEREPPQQTE